MSANRENLSDRGNAPAAPIGVRTRTLVAGHWALLVFAVAVAVAMVVFILLPGWLAPGRLPGTPIVKPASPPVGKEVVASPQAPALTRAPSSAEAAAPTPGQVSAPSPDAHEAAAPDHTVEQARERPAAADRNVAGRQFAQLMSRGLAHAERAEWQDAERAFRAAAQLRPADRAAADGLARAKEGLERSQVTALRSAAQQFESEERWTDALAAYRQSLQIDPTLEFAKLGSERSERMVRLHADLAALLADPRRLYSPLVRDAARNTLAAADAVPGGGPRLAEARARLDAALHRATTPIAVHLTSDEVTDVTVYRVGPLGRFQARDLELVPGAYTVVGARAGYKDVRIELKVEPDAPAPRVFVACREPV